MNKDVKVVSKGRIKEMSFGAGLKLSHKYQSLDSSFFITKEFDADESIDWDMEKQLLVEEVEDFISEKFVGTKESLLAIAKQMG